MKKEVDSSLDSYPLCVCISYVYRPAFTLSLGTFVQDLPWNYKMHSTPLSLIHRI